VIVQAAMEVKRSRDAVAAMKGEYEALQKQSLVISMQYEQQCETLRKLRARQDHMETTLTVTRSMHKRNDTAVERTILDNAAEIQSLRQKLEEKEALLRTQVSSSRVVLAEMAEPWHVTMHAWLAQVQIRALVTHELTSKRNEVKRLEGQLVEKEADHRRVVQKLKMALTGFRKTALLEASSSSRRTSRQSVPEAVQPSEVPAQD
jgi:hypothetical protein